jgi:hypothetical protein
MSIDGKKLLAEIQANSKLIANCPRHRVDPTNHKFGQKMTCLNCGGKRDAYSFLMYARGYKAAGGDPNDIWPGWKDEG